MEKRILTALVLLIVLIPVLMVGGILFNLAVLAIGIMAIKEMLDIRDGNNQLPITMKLIGCISFVYLVSSFSGGSDFTYLLDYRIIAFISLILLLPIVIYHDKDVYNINDALYMLGLIFFLGLSFNLIITIRNTSLMTLIYLLIVTIATDAYALFGGLLIGKHKLLESISPNKTWGGLIIGTIFGVLIASVFYYIAINDGINISYLIICTTLLSLIGQFGDLVFSSIKRIYGKKDFSNLLPGHGGILDRFDSFIFVALGYVFLMFIL